MNYAQQIETMLATIKHHGITDPALLQAMKKVPRHLFVLPEYKDDAYDDCPLPIGHGQTISQPYTVAFMIEHLELKKGIKVLEVGAGSGWSAALIGEIIGSAGKVYATEIIQELADFARKNLKKAGITNVEVISYDGSQGYSKHSPYDRILINAACPSVPLAIIKQLKDKGIIIAPVGAPTQTMVKIIKEKDNLREFQLGSFSFVPLKGKFGY